MKLYFVIKHWFLGIIFDLFSIINSIIPHKKNKILIYDPDHDKHDNTGALFDYLISEGYNKKYIIVHCCHDYKLLGKESLENVYYVRKIMGIFHYFTSNYVYYRAATIRIIPAKGQQVIQMWHGSPCKGAPAVFNKVGRYNPYYTGFFSASRNFHKIFEDIFSIPPEKMILCGHPRTDILFKRKAHYDFGEYKKIVIWTPTFRKYKWKKIGTVSQMKNDDKLLPIIPFEKLVEVNDFLKEKSVKVVVKLHPMQCLENYKKIELDHFILLSNEEFKKRGMDLYSFMTQCDAMITDYSSIYWDYLVLDRPIGFTEDDAKDYAEGRGFVMKDPELYKPGHKLLDIKDFYNFIEDLVSGNDVYKKQRKAMNEYGNPVTDGYSCRRALQCVGITI